MSRPLRRPCSPAGRSRILALCLSSATFLAVVAPMNAGPASGADADGYVDLALYTDGDPRQGFGQPRVFTLPNGQVSPLLPGPGTAYVSVRDVSAQGDRIATVQDDPAGTQSRLVIRDISGAVVRVVATYDRTDVIQEAALTPSGDRVAWITRSPSPAPDVVQTAKVLSGPTTVVPGINFLVGFAAEDLLVGGVVGRQELLTVTLDGATMPITFLDGGAPAWDEVSRDGTRVAFARVSSAPNTTTRVDLYSAEVLRVGSAISVGPALLLSPEPVTQANANPTVAGFTRDGQDIVFLQGSDQFGATSFATVPATGGPRTTIGTSILSGELLGNAHVAAKESSAPSAPSAVGPVRRVGPQGTIPYAVPADPTASFVVATRTSPGLPPKTLRAAVPSPLVDTGVVAGRTYTYAVRQVDRSGNTGPATTGVLRQSAPTAAVRVSGQRLTAGQFLRSANGVRVRVNPDGNLVALSPSGKVLFQSRTRGTRPVLRVNADGNVVLLSGNRVLWQTRTAGQGTAALVVQDDGNVVLYRDRDGRAAWSTRGGRTY